MGILSTGSWEGNRGPNESENCLENYATPLTNSLIKREMVFSYLMTIGKTPGVLVKYQFLLNVIIPKYPRFVMASYQIISSMFDEIHMLMSFLFLIIFKVDYYQFWKHN